MKKDVEKQGAAITTTPKAETKGRKELMWAGAANLMVPSNTPKGKAENAIVKLVATVLDVSPYGVNVLGGQPYVNNLGLRQKLEQYGQGKLYLESEPVQMAKDDTEKAIWKSRIIDTAGKPYHRMPWVYGECSPKTIGMSTLQGYQNHLAETRSVNRTIRYAFGVKMHEDMLIRIGKIQGSEFTDEQKFKALGAPAMSSEEMERGDSRGGSKEKVAATLTSKEFEEIKDAVEMLNGIDSAMGLTSVTEWLGKEKRTGRFNAKQLAYLTELHRKASGRVSI